MKRIPLTNSHETAMIDDQDLPLISQFSWRSEDGYAVTDLNGQTIEMGCLILHPWLATGAGSAN